MKKKALGRGLSALMGETEGDRKFFMCSIEKIYPSKTQPRKVFDESALEELTASIREKGIIEPLVVRRRGEGFELIAGERRLRAARRAGLKEVPVAVMEADDESALELSLIENIQREELNPIEEAEAYRGLVGFGLSQEEVAKRVGKDRATVANYLRLLKLPDEVKAELSSGRLTMGHARAILALSEPPLQRDVARKVIARGLSVRETERLVKRLVEGSPEDHKHKKDVHTTGLEEELRGIFGTKVSLKERRGRGRIVIEFYSPEERERIIGLLRTVGD